MAQGAITGKRYIYDVRGHYRVRILPLADGLFRLSFTTGAHFAEPLLNRYHFLKEDWPPVETCEATTDDAFTLKAGDHRLIINRMTGRISFDGPPGLELAVMPLDRGFRLSLPLDPRERLFGLGDETRECIMKRGRKASLRVQNIKCYIPVPWLISNRGWGLMVNTTFRHDYDLGADDPQTAVIRATDGPCDLYLFFASGFAGLLDLYTQLSGRPALLPRYAYGYTFICNEQNDARAMLDDARLFRQSGIPCDCIGLEPGWMEKHYDLSVHKKWHPQRFYIPYWIREKVRHHRLTFFGALHRLGFRLSLWICCDYDLLWEEENKTLVDNRDSGTDTEIDDIHLANAVRLDQCTVPGQPWFDHLKPFVDQGVSAFKLDAAFFVNEHPDRLWAEHYRDREVHNLLPLVYGRQMSRGYTEHTGERAMINIPIGYVGIQRYCATWAGDTGGGAGALVSMLNLGFCGITHTSCDIRVTDIESIHFGFLLPWTQQNNWNYWCQPWLLGEELEDAIRFYARFRSQLFPYLYACAHISARTGLPIMRSMSLAWPDEPAYDSILTQYMLGDGLLVSAFSDSVTLPPGLWIDVWTGVTYQGGRTIHYIPPAGRGGGLFARAGAIIPLQPWASCLERFQPDQFDLHIYPGGDFALDLIEDDGNSCGYRDGQLARTTLAMCQIDSGASRLTIGRRTGSFPGMSASPALRVLIHSDARPVLTEPGGSAIAVVRESDCWSFVISSERHMTAVFTCDCRFC